MSRLPSQTNAPTAGQSLVATSPTSAAWQSVARLTRQSNVDPLTSTPGAIASGSQSAPYASLTAWITAASVFPVPASSADDANTVQMAIVSPAPASAFAADAAIAIPPYRNVYIRSEQATQSSSNQGNQLVSAITWNNSHYAGAVAPAAASLTLDGTLFAAGSSLTIIDDGSVNAILSLVGNNGTYSLGGQGFFGNITATGATALGSAFFIGVNLLTCTLDAPNTILTFDGCRYLSGTGVTGANFIDAINSEFLVPINAGNGSFFNCDFTSSAITFTGGAVSFSACTFFAACVVTAATASFDSVSWASLMERGGSVVGTALVVGGFNGGAGAVEGAALTNANVSVSLNGGGATAGFTGGGNHYTLLAATLTGAHTVKLGTGGAENGDTLCITRQDVTANTYQVLDDTGANLGTLPVLSKGFVIARYNGTHWVFMSGGSGVT